MNIKTQINLWKLLILLELINYQVVTIVCNDFILLKFSRDIVLILIVASFFMRNKVISKDMLGRSILILFVVFLLAVINTSGLNASFVFLRKYISPILLFYVVVYEKSMCKEYFISIFRYLLNLLSILSLWGIVQAHILGPDFLIKLGYPTQFSYAYQAITLKYSFYFGNFGIQRVVATLSNTNVFALILGSFILLTVINYKEILVKRIDWIKIIVIAIAYVLTFSRANFLALIIVAIIVAWKFIPYKECIVYVGLLVCCAFMILYIYQDETGISHKLVNWVVSSLTFTESSAAGRGQIWETGLDAVLENPFGIGYGNVGSWAQTAGKEVFYHCENSYLAMALDLGWFGVIAYIYYLLTLMFKAYRVKYIDRLKSKSVIAILIYMMIAFMFSNHIYDKEAITIIFFVVGIMINYLTIVKEKKN